MTRPDTAAARLLSVEDLDRNEAVTRRVVRLHSAPRGTWHRGYVLTALIPKVFYEDVAVGLDLFVEAIGMDVLHRDQDLVVAARDGAKVYLVQDADFAAKDRSEIAIETDDIETVFADITARRRDLLHPNLSRVTRRSGGQGVRLAGRAGSLRRLPRLDGLSCGPALGLERKGGPAHRGALTTDF
jgi:hypothetical protein